MTELLSEPVESILGFVMVVIFVLLVCGIVSEEMRIQRIREDKERRQREREEAECRWRIEMVNRTSTKYQDLLKINARYRFNNQIKTCYECKANVNSKAQYDRFDYDEFLKSRIEDQLPVFENVIAAIEHNRKLYQWYHTETTAVLSRRTDALALPMPEDVYTEIENDLCSSVVIEPVLDMYVKCSVSYVSPQGRNAYQDYQLFSYDQVVWKLNEVKKKLERRETGEYQRKKMTDSIRYDVLKRDGFKCVLCGRSAQDGVKLHVDHILPVSKGGKTEMSNLRTLCQTCNMGKRDKYDESGWN